MFIYVSNHIEVLLKRLKDAVNDSSIVACASIGLQKAVQDCLGPDSAIKLTTLQEAIEQMLPFKPPSYIDIAVWVEDTLIQCMKNSEYDTLLSNYKGLTDKLVIGLSDRFYKWCWEGKEEKELIVSPYTRLVDMLWERFMSSGWKMPAAYFSGTNTPACPCMMHFFGFSYMPPLLFSYLTKPTSEFCKIGYFFSPCMMFWADILSDKQANSVRRHARGQVAETLSHHLFDRNLLLANCGSPGKVLHGLIEEHATTLKEEYVVKAALMDHPAFSDCIRHDAVAHKQDGKPSLLDYIQTDLLTLVRRRGCYIACDVEDRSIQVHSCPTLLREVEILYDEIQKHCGKRSVVIMPDVEIYRPYIERVFGEVVFIGNTPILPRSVQSSFFALLELPKRRFSAEAIFQALSSSKALSQEDIKRLGSLFLEAGFRWGKDAEQRRTTFLQEGYEGDMHEGDAGSWSSFENKVLELWTCGELEPVFAQSLGTAISKVRLLFSLLDCGPAPRSLQDWTNTFTMLSEEFFAGDDTLKKAISELAAYHHEPQELSFNGAVRLLRRCVAATPCLSEVATNTLIFGSFDGLAGYPADALFLIGMNEGAISGINKYHTIVACQSARHTLYISYQGFSFEDRLTLMPAGVVTELLKMLSEGYTGVTTHTTHPLAREMPQVLENNVFQNIEKKLFTLHTTHSQEIVDISKLSRVARSPLQSYFHNTLALYLPSYREKRVSDKLVDLPKREIHGFLRRHLGADKESLSVAALAFASAYSGVLTLATASALEDARDKLQEAFTKWSLNPKESIHVTLSLGCTALEEVSKGHFRCPAIQFETGHILHGSMQGMHTEGHILFEHASDDAIIREYPILLLRAYLQEQYRLCKGDTVYFCKNQKKMPLAFLNPRKELERYLLYALESASQPHILYPNLVCPLATGQVDEVKKSIQEGGPYSNLYFDPYLKLFAPTVSQIGHMIAL